ncbi:hypothetical protein [Persicobacter diffluens]|uniref:hypothetical protein n=1 Tax=Persicobacter diffluens TaxID=981 RepID=UPI0030C6EAF7
MFTHAVFKQELSAKLLNRPGFGGVAVEELQDAAFQILGNPFFSGLSLFENRGFSVFSSHIKDFSLMAVNYV